MEVVIADSAEHDLDDIFDFIAQDSEFYAHLIISEIKQWCFINLEAVPRIGRLKSENPEIRQTVGPYKYTIRYLIKNNRVFITMVYKNYK